MLILIISFISLLALIAYFIANFDKIADTYINKKYKQNSLAAHQIKIDEQTTIHYWQGGQGKETLVLIHGFGAAAKFQWISQINDFSKEYHLIIPDLIYFGNSHSDSQEFGIDFQAQSVSKLLQELGITSFSLVSLSYGGVVAITLANLVPKQVHKLVICGSPIRYYTDEDIEETLGRLEVNSFEELLLPNNTADVKKLIALAYHRPPYIPNFILKSFNKGLFAEQIPEKKKLLSYLFDHRIELSTREFELSCPILLLWGAHDSLIPKKIGQSLEAYFGKEQATFLTIENTAHAPSAERPKVFNKLVLDFLKSKK